MNEHSSPSRCMTLALPLALALLLSGGTVSAQVVDTDSNGIDVEATDLGRRLIKGNTRGAADADVMVRLLRQMDVARQRLHRGFDPGASTQLVQRDVLRSLDEAIALALQQRREGDGAPSGAGDPRRMPVGPRGADQASRPSAASGKEDRARRGEVNDEADARSGGHLDETQRMWGNLPPRDREAIVQSMGETVLEQYRALIEAYYAALA